MLTNAASGVDVASRGMSVAVAGNASCQRPSVRRIASVPRLATLAKLSDVTRRTSALFDPRRGIFEVVGSPRRLQDDVVQDADAVRRVSRADADGRDVGENLLKDDGLHAR